MTDSIEAFVQKLHKDGVEVGKKEAERLIAEAKEEAERIVAKAEEDAREIIRAAEGAAKNTLARAETELKLASRDISARLRETLLQTLERALAAGVRKELHDSSLLKSIISDLLKQYTAADSAHNETIQLSVSKDMEDQLTEWMLSELQQTLGENNAGIDLQRSLQQAGFECRVAGSTVEVTEDSVVAALSELISPRLRKILTQEADSDN